MPRSSVIAQARRDKRAGQKPSTQAGEFVRDEMHHLGATHVKSRKQAIAVGLSEARRAGVKVPARKQR